MMMRLTAVLLIGIAFSAVAAEEEKPASYPDTAGPFVGDWTGFWSSGEDKHPWISAQVIPMGHGNYDIVLKKRLYVRAPLFKAVTANEDGGALVFDDGEYYGRIQGDTFTGGRRGDKPGEFDLERYIWESPDLGLKPPPGAVVLFDGSGFEAWRRFPKGKSWEILPGKVLQANPDIGYIESEQKFTDVKLHVEFRLPFLPEERGQGRANSGVFLQKYFEVQILDSYGLPGYWNECGAIYQISPPHVNRCAPPLQWQSFDIEFHAARYDGGTLIENPRMTVRHNGVIVQKDVEMPHGTSYDFKKKPVPPPSTPERIRIQAHKNCVQFRNIWIVDLAAK